jgi:RNA polymerase sigma-70 factor (ECF subfamily)
LAVPDDEVLLAELRARWPRGSWTSERIAAYDPDALATEHRSDVLWAWACQAGDVAALAELDAGPLGDAREHLRVMGFPATTIDEAVQRARTKLVFDGGLRTYRGRGPLGMFVRTAVVRFAIDDRRAARRDAQLDEMLAAPNVDPELEYMRKLYAEQLVAAVREAWTRLAPHEQFVLALRVYEGMSVDDVARVYRIHRASAARRVAAARAALIGHARTALRDRLSVDESTLDSILRVVATSMQLPLDEPIRG